MKNKTNIQNPQTFVSVGWKSRRKFLQTMGLFITGVGMIKPSLLFAKKGLHGGENTFALNVMPEGIFRESVPLPEGVKAVWDLNKAYRQSTTTREHISINGLWQWQPGERQFNELPVSNWGYFKVPGPWHNSTDKRNETQKLFAHPDWKSQLLENVTVAWCQREINISENWTGRRIMLKMEYLNSNAIVYIDGQKAGELWFPWGELDLTPLCKAGRKHLLSMKVNAYPMKDVVTAYSDSNMARQVEATVVRRGLCGDVYLIGLPSGPSIDKVTINTSVREAEITFKTELLNLDPGKRYSLRVLITDGGTKVTEFTGKAFDTKELTDGCINLSKKWIAEKLWDTHTPQNMYMAEISLLDTGGKLLDVTVPVRFGYREFWIDGRDFYLNGTRIWFSCIPLDNAQSGIPPATYEGAKMSLQRLKDTGINFMYTHNYSCEPGTHISFEEILRAADDTGMMIAMSQPHFSNYEWDKPDADANNGYAHHAAFYAHVAQNHPSVVFYSTSHNASGYNQDMNPDQVGGPRPEPTPGARNNIERARRAEAIIRKLDPNRIVYHHHSGNNGQVYTCNFYGNWIPSQEMSEWFGHWSTAGEKPALLLEYSTPFTWDYGMYRGWYKGVRDFGRALVPWEFCLAEWNSQFIGDKAYEISEYEKENLRWEAAKFRAGELWGRSDYPYNFDSAVLDERNMVLAEHFAANWRAFRTWGLSGMNAMWHYTQYWRLKKDVNKGPVIYETDWENLQKPGLSPDFITQQRERIDMGYELSDWEQTIAAKAITDNQGALVAYIGGKPEAFTDKTHNLFPGQSFEKQLIIINNSRVKIQCKCSWILNLPQAKTGSQTVNLPTGQQERVPLHFDLPSNLAPGQYELKAEFIFDNGKSYTDTFSIHVLPEHNTGKLTTKIALFDPKGETMRMLDGFEITYKSIEAGSDLAGIEVLIIGKGALSTESPMLDLSSVRNGLKIIMFEQTSEVLEKRFGFRVQEYGLRRVHKRISDHPVLAGLEGDFLHNWSGEATLLPPQLPGAPNFKWCDIPVTRVWRCGNRGNVASVLIEKPACGNFLPLIDGGFSLQYSTLMEYCEGQGMVMFCQMDVTGRTETDPAADRLARNIISYVSGWKPAKNRQAVYAGDAAGQSHLEKAGVSALRYDKKKTIPRAGFDCWPGRKSTFIIQCKRYR